MNIRKKWLKADFHIHTSEDRFDTFVKPSAKAYIDQAAKAGYEVLAITLHDYLYTSPSLERYAQKKGIILFTGIEKTIQKREILIINATPKDVNNLTTFADLERLRHKKPSVLVIAPHPYYFLSVCAGKELLTSPHLFDAVEHSFFYCNLINPNKKAARVAQQLGKPLLANSDHHFAFQFNKNYTLLYAKKTKKGILDALRHGKKEEIALVSTPYSFFSFVFIGSFFLLHGFYYSMKRNIFGTMNH